jgi:hypothetical protein
VLLVLRLLVLRLLVLRLLVLRLLVLRLLVLALALELLLALGLLQGLLVFCAGAAAAAFNGAAAADIAGAAAAAKLQAERTDFFSLPMPHVSSCPWPICWPSSFPRIFKC